MVDILVAFKLIFLTLFKLLQANYHRAKTCIVISSNFPHKVWINIHRNKIQYNDNKKRRSGSNHINKKFLTCQLLTEIFCQALTEFEIFCQDLTEFEIFCQGLTDIFCQGLTEFFGLFMWSADRFFSVKCWQIFFFKQQSLLTDFWASWQILDSLDRNFLSRGVQLTPLFDLKYQLGV